MTKSVYKNKIPLYIHALLKIVEIWWYDYFERNESYPTWNSWYNLNSKSNYDVFL